MIPSILPQEAYEKIETGNGVLVDVRETDELLQSRGPITVHAPLSSFRPDLLLEQNLKHNDVLFLICRVGGRSAQACEILVNAGFKNVYNVEGGMIEWENQNLPTKSGPIA